MRSLYRRALIAVTALGAASSAFGAAAPLPEVAENDIRYPSPQAALEAVRARPGVEVSVNNGWTIVADPRLHEVWSFAPQDHPAYPTAVKRAVTPAPQGSMMTMSVDCHSTKAACDDVVRQFEELNAKLPGQAPPPRRAPKQSPVS